MDGKETPGFRSCLGLWEMPSARRIRGGHCAALNFLAMPHLWLTHAQLQEGRVEMCGFSFFYNQLSPLPQPHLRLNYSDSLILIWNNYFPLWIAASFLLIPKKEHCLRSKHWHPNNTSLYFLKSCSVAFLVDGWYWITRIKYLCKNRFYDWFNMFYCNSLCVFSEGYEIFVNQDHT